MTPRTLRGRLTAAAALAVVLAVAFLAVCARLLVAHQLHASLDTSLRRRATDVARLPMGRDRKRRRTWPRGWTSRAPHAGHRQVLGSWWMVKMTWPPWYSVRTYS